MDSCIGYVFTCGELALLAKCLDVALPACMSVGELTDDAAQRAAEQLGQDGLILRDAHQLAVDNVVAFLILSLSHANGSLELRRQQCSWHLFDAPRLALVVHASPNETWRITPFSSLGQAIAWLETDIDQPEAFAAQGSLAPVAVQPKTYLQWKAAMQDRLSGYEKEREKNG